MQQNTFEKNNYIGKMIVEQIIEFELKGLGPPGPTCTPTTGYFYDKTAIFWSGLLFTARIFHAALYLTFSYPAKSFT